MSQRRFLSNVTFVSVQEPVIPGCFLRAKAIGLMPMIDQGEADDKIIAVCADDPEYKHYNDIKELPPHRLAEIRRFFEDCILLYSFHQYLVLLAKNLLSSAINVFIIIVKFS